MGREMFQTLRLDRNYLREAFRNYIEVGLPTALHTVGAFALEA
jgi:hypothetical protein